MFDVTLNQLVVAPSFPYHTHTFVTREIASTLERGHQVTVLSPTTGDDAGQAFADSLGIPHDCVLYLNERQCAMWSFDWCRFRTDIRKEAWPGWYGRRIGERRKTFLCKALELLSGRPRPDIIHAHFAGWAFEVAMPLSNLLGVPFTLIAHNGNLIDFRPEMLQALQKKAAKVYLVSPAYEEIWSNKTTSPEKLQVLPNAVDLDEFRLPANARHRGVRPTIVSVCRLVDQKRVRDGILAIRALLDRGVDCDYQIIGDGPERDGLVATVKDLSLEDRIKFHGTVSHARVAELLSESDILLHPSELESFGIAILEAMASSLPVVAARSDGSTSTVLHDITGYLYEPGDIDAIVNRMATLLDSPSACAQMGAAGRERAEKDFSWKARMDRLESDWFNIIGGRA